VRQAFAAFFRWAGVFVAFTTSLVKIFFTLIVVFFIAVNRIPNIIALNVPDDAREATYFFAQGMSGLFIYGILQHVAEHINWVYTYLDKGVFILFILIAVSLFLLREFYRVAFATTEIIVSVVILLNISLNLPTVRDAITRNQFLALLVLSVYVMVRGCDNLWQSIRHLWRGPCLPAPAVSLIDVSKILSLAFILLVLTIFVDIWFLRMAPPL
jgi:hypothetical protein